VNHYLVKGAVVTLAGAAALMGCRAGAASAAPDVIGGQLLSVSCASAGNCGAGGAYDTSSGKSQALVVSEVHGVWGQAEQVPGTGALNASGAAEVTSVSCASAGNCSAGGYYTGDAHAPNDQQAFVVSEVHGVWGQAEQVPGLAALNTGFTASVQTVSCGAAGNCSAGGTYEDGSLGEHPFVVTEVGGVWGKVEQVPGTGNGQLISLSCTSAGSCGAVGYDTETASDAFVAREVHGVWGQAAQVPGLAALDQGHNASPASLSCPSTGNCAADGFYTDKAGDELAFVVSEVNGVWGQAAPLPGAGAPRYQVSEPSSVSCASAGSCGTGGQFGGPTAEQAFVAGEVNGAWGRAEQVPGSGALNLDHLAQVSTVSCGAAGSCGAGGYYTSGHGYKQAFLVNLVNGVWGQAEQVPGLAVLNTGHIAQLNSVSCASAGNCGAAGFYDAAGHYQAFVVSQVNGIWAKAETIRGPAS
jgi:hypothetical protein